MNDLDGVPQYERYNFSRRQSGNRNRKNSYNSEQYVSRENSSDRRGGDSTLPRMNRSRRNSGRYSQSRETSSERYAAATTIAMNNQQPRDPNSWRSDFSSRNVSEEKTLPTPGILVLPTLNNVNDTTTINENSSAQSSTAPSSSSSSVQQRILFDPKNPSKPIVIQSQNSRNYTPPEDTTTNTKTITTTTTPTTSSTAQQHQNNETVNKTLIATKASISEQCLSARPIWYDRHSDNYKLAHKPQLIDSLEKIDMQMQLLVGSGALFNEWDHYMSLRKSVQNLMEQFIVSEIKFCQQENVENHFWKILYYNLIELVRKTMTEDPDVNNKAVYKQKLLQIINDGSTFLEMLLQTVERTFKFDLNDYLGSFSGRKYHCRPIE